MSAREAGYSLLELLFVISILFILLGIATPFGKIIAENRQLTQIAQLNRMVEMARNNAITTRETTTLCASADGSHCDADAQLPTILIFADRNSNREFDADDRKVHHAALSHKDWHWRGSAHRPYLRFRADGSVMEWGRFTLCPEKGVPYASQLVLNIAGRPYIEKLSGDELMSSTICN